MEKAVKGDPRIIIYINKKKVYDSLARHKKATGPDFIFNDIASIEFKNGDSIKIVLADADILADDILISQESSNLNSIKQMLDGKHEKDGSWYQCKLLKCTPGKYRIQLVVSNMAQDDIDASIYKIKLPVPVIPKFLLIPLITLYLSGKTGKKYSRQETGETIVESKRYGRTRLSIYNEN